MTSTTVTVQNTTAVEFLSMPITWQSKEEGEVLTTDGEFRLDELYKHLPPDNALRKQQQPDRYLKVKIGDAAGDISLIVRLHPSEPPLDAGPWESIEQAGAEFTFPEPRCMTEGLRDEVTALRPLLAQVPNGWNMVRASRRGVHPDVEGAVLQIDIWPITGPAGLQRIKHQPTPRPRPKKGSYLSATGNRHNPISHGVETQWRQLTYALWVAGDLTVTVRDRGIYLRDSGAVDKLAQDTGLPFTPLLWEWFRIQDHYPAGRWDNLLPGYQLLNPEQAGRTRAQRLTEPKKDTTTLSPSHVPIATATQSRALLVADLSPGPATGSVREIGAATQRKWRSPAHLTRELADAIEYRLSFLDHLPDFTHHALRWTRSN